MKNLLLPLAMMAVSCSSNGTTTAPPAGSEIKFTTLPYTLHPGEEKYFCYTMDLPTDAVLTEMTPTYGKATHHFGFYYTIAPEPKGFSECPVLIKQTWIPIWVGGKDSGALKLPSGAGLGLGKGQQVLIQLHLLNATKADVTDTGTMTMTTAVDPTAPFAKAGIFGMDNRALAMPPKTNAIEQSMSCTAPYDMDVFALFGHMHTLGKRIEVTRGASEMIYSSAWSFDQQPTTPKSFHVKKDETFNLRCVWDNPTDKMVTYGESTLDEMCSFVFYYTPWEHLDGCVKTAK